MSEDYQPRSGFTLVELLVVIGIIAVLIGVLLPALNKARKAAQEAQCMSNLRQFGFGFQTYADANKGFLPQDGQDGSNTTYDSKLIGRNNPNQAAYDATSGEYVPYGVDDPALWYNAIPPLINNRSYYSLIQDYVYNGKPQSLPSAGANSIWVCPGASQPESSWKGNGFGEIYAGLGKTDPTTGVGNYFGLFGVDSKNRNNAREFPFYQSYVMNSKLFGQLASGQYINWVKMAQLRPGSDVVLMVEKMMTSGEYAQSSDPEVYNYYPNPGAHNLTPQGYTSNIGQPKACNTRFTTQHRHGGFLLFADGHVDWFAWTQVQPLINAAYLSNPDLPANQSINRPDNHVIWNPFGAVTNGSGS